MPLTPASWAGDLEGAASRHNSARLANATLPAVHRCEKIETSWMRFINGVPLPTRHIHLRRTWNGPPKFHGRNLSIVSPCFGQTAVNSGAVVDLA
jgi:hypothetical protein